MDHDEAVKIMVSSALSTPAGKQHVMRANGHLTSELVHGRFNSERAKEVLTMAVDRAFAASLEGLPVKWMFLKDYKASGLGALEGEKLAQLFIKTFDAHDQRPARRWFRFLMGA